MPTAIFADNDLSAIGAMGRLNGLGFRAPEDVSVLGFDDIPDAGSKERTLSTFRQDTDGHARALVRALEMRIRWPEMGPYAIEGRATFIIRRSIGSAPRNQA